MNTRNSKSWVVRCGASLGFGWCLAAAAAVLAQQPAQPADAATQKPDAAAQTPAAPMALQKQAEATPVTGSHIRRVRTPDPSLPLLELDRAYIERSGATNAGELIRTVPQANSH
jgi:hypothetical protein